LAQTQLNVHNYLSTGTLERVSMAGALPNAPIKGGQQGQWCLFHNNIFSW